MLASSNRKKVTRRSEINDAGDGLFATKDLVAGETVAFYNGIRVSPGQTPPFKSTSYEICVDWVCDPVSNDSDYMDIPPHYVSVENYRATLGHKINHSFTPNCGWETIQHPVFGKIPSVVALADVKKGTTRCPRVSWLLFPPTISTDGVPLIQRDALHVTL